MALSERSKLRSYTCPPSSVITKIQQEEKNFEEYNMIYASLNFEGVFLHIWYISIKTFNILLGFF